MTINILHFFGSICMDPEDGAALFGTLFPKLKGGESVCVDFSGVTTLTSSFLNPGIGSLYGHIDLRVVDALLTVVGLDDVDAALVDEVRKNAIRFFALNHDQQNHLAAHGPALTC